MKRLVVTLGLLATLPMLADSGEVTSLNAAIVNEIYFAIDIGMVHPETKGLDPSTIVVDALAARCKPDVMAAYVSRYRGRVITEEIVEACRASDASPARLRPDDANPIQVMDLDAFRNGEESYDWERLHAVHPEVRAVVRISPPAVDSTSTFGVVRYDVLTPNGFAWGGIDELERDSRGSWSAPRGQLGDCRSAPRD